MQCSELTIGSKDKLNGELTAKKGTIRKGGNLQKKCQGKAGKYSKDTLASVQVEK